jgi:S-adenosylmethionine:tRNA ribosyltransferase-isomerase
MIAGMDVRDFDFDLPTELIAQEPPAARSASRLLHLDRASGALTHTTIPELPALLRAGDLIVVNNTRVFPARLIGRRIPSGGAVECLLIRRVDDQRWEALVHPGQKLKPGAGVLFEGAPGQPRVHGEVLERRFHGRRTLRLWTDDGGSVDEAIDAIGHVPLPPYIKREDRGDDRERYQTVFATARGSVAAPTAGLHFDAALLRALGDCGVEIAEITLHVGYGTFQPVRVERVEEHTLDSEQYEIGEATASAIARARGERRRIIAVGTTTTRTLEAVARDHAGQIVAGAGRTDLFIYPGFEFRVIGGLLTNFHVPRSSLLMLVAAFAGRERVLAAYEAAIAARYRFYSYGDAMLIT